MGYNINLIEVNEEIYKYLAFYIEELTSQNESITLRDTGLHRIDNDTVSHLSHMEGLY